MGGETCGWWPTGRYVAYVRAYKEHQCSYIFKMSDLDLGELARALAVLRLPKLRELGEKRYKKGGGGWVEWTPLVEVRGRGGMRT